MSLKELAGGVHFGTSSFAVSLSSACPLPFKCLYLHTTSFLLQQHRTATAAYVTKASIQLPLFTDADEGFRTLQPNYSVLSPVNHVINTDRSRVFGRPEFELEPVPVAFVVDKMVLGHVYLRALRCRLWLSCVCCYLMCICCTMWALLFFYFRCRTAG